MDMTGAEGVHNIEVVDGRGEGVRSLGTPQSSLRDDLTQGVPWNPTSGLCMTEYNVFSVTSVGDGRLFTSGKSLIVFRSVL